ncbi:Hypothetical_protein [Hexamita inflata]|uniref:Hypothetical_protein n=1 Tax=Hexamita inflata TaxID=28002 RepID=A0AA86PJM4_9EUKA|nr:Hypothetical protein HINF_LOCUS26018 [Hexamita inflata]
MQQPKLQIYFFNSCIVVTVSTSPENILFREITINLLYLEQCENIRKKSMEKILVKIYLYVQFQYNSNPRQFLSRMGTLGRLLLIFLLRLFKDLTLNGIKIVQMKQKTLSIYKKNQVIHQTQNILIFYFLIFE